MTSGTRGLEVVRVLEASTRSLRLNGAPVDLLAANGVKPDLPRVASFSKIVPARAAKNGRSVHPHGKTTAMVAGRIS
jgi:hypothetical protein